MGNVNRSFTYSTVKNACGQQLAEHLYGSSGNANHSGDFLGTRLNLRRSIVAYFKFIRLS